MIARWRISGFSAGRSEVLCRVADRGCGSPLNTNPRETFWHSVRVALALLLLTGVPVANAGTPEQAIGTRQANPEPITPIPQPPIADPLKLELGRRLFEDRRLSRDGSLACSSCHDVATNGADDGHRGIGRDNAPAPLNTPTVFNAALSFRLDWEGDFRTLEAQAEASLRNSTEMAASIGAALRKLRADPDMVRGFEAAYGQAPDKSTTLDAIAIYERSLLTPGSRFDRWLEGDAEALTASEQAGYQLFKSVGCVSCHQGVNVGGNLFERHGVFRPIGSPKPELLRVPSLRNVATTPPYFHDGSAPTLNDAVRRMAAAQLNQSLSGEQIDSIVAFLGTLTGKYRDTLVTVRPP